MDEQKIYIGPSVAALGLMRNQVYLNGIPGEVQSAIAKYPDVELMIVPVEDFIYKSNEMNTPGTELNHVMRVFKKQAGGAH